MKMALNFSNTVWIVGFLVVCDVLVCVLANNATLPLIIQDGWYKSKQIDSALGFFYSNSKYLACDTSESKEPKNWLRTDFIKFNGAKRVFIDISYTLRKCKPSSLFCKESFELYVTQTSQSASLPLPPSGFEKIAVARPTNLKLELPDEKDIVVLNATVKAHMEGFFLAFYDRGSCITLYSIKIRYNFCPENANYLEMVKFPEVISPAEDVGNQGQVHGSCSDSNARNTSELLGVCTMNGVWKMSDRVKCMCKPGYGYSSSPKKQCIVCGAGQYKSSLNNSNCKKCPSGSYPHAQKTTCRCNTGLFRLNTDNIDEPCKALPDGPKFANATTWNSTAILVSWPSNRDITFSVECFVCKTSTDKKCVEPCNRKTVFNPGKTALKSRVSVSGLKSGSRFKFLVYGVSLLNTKVSKSEWKYAVTFGFTKEGPPEPTSTVANTYTFKEMALTIGLPVLATLLLIIVICAVCLWRRSNRKYGTRVPGFETTDSHELPTIGQKVYIDPTNYDDPEEALKNFAKELDTCSLSLEKVIGGGEFGDVYKGILRRLGEDPLPVAIKTLKKESTKKNRDDFLLEASVMGQFCDPNVIFLEGVVTKSHPLMIVTEFMSNGSLDNFLKEMDSKLSVLQMLGMARGVSSGMKFLSEMNFVHRDLAARNILVSETLVCKVADFGLSRELEDSAYETRGGKIPVRWTAPEAIKYRKFSTSSDVWSYGILLWEIMSFAERPYWDWSNFEVMDRVEGGFRLPPPMQCPTAVHQVMLECWNSDRALRPKFADIVKHLDTLIRSPEKLKENLPIQASQPNIDYTDGTTIAEWLKSIKMAQYTERFVQAGYGNLKNLAEFEEPNLEEMGIRLIGHKNKIKKSIREVRKKLHRESSLPV